MNKHFPFGTLFIKASRGFCILTAIIGLSASIFLLSQWRSNVIKAGYKPNPQIALKVKELNITYKDTLAIATTFHQKHMSGKEGNKKVVQFYKLPKAYEEYATSIHMADLKNSLGKIRNNVDKLKLWFSGDFDTHADILINRLQETYEKKRQQSVDGNDTEHADKSTPLFAALNLSDFQRKRELLNKNLTEIQNLPTQRPEFIAAKNAMLAQMNDFYSYLEGHRLEDSKESSESSKLRVFKILRQMQDTKKVVHEIVVNDWSFDQEYMVLTELVNLEESKCLKAEERLQDIATLYGMRFAVTVLLSIVFCIGILVIADLLKALFIIATKN